MQTGKERRKHVWAALGFACVLSMIALLLPLKAEAAVTCVWCHGKGEVTCSACGGSGRGSGSVRGSCYKCHGSGYETCRYCGGTGKLGSGSSANATSGVTSDGSFVSISSGSVTLVAGRKTKLSVSGTKKKVRWKSSKSGVASVSSKGVVKAKKAGKAKITATIGKTKLTCVVKVKKKKYATGLSVPSTVSLVLGRSMTAPYTLKPAGVTEKAKITWKSANKGVVTVDKNGTLRGTGAGSAKVTATLKKKNGKKKKVSFTVTVQSGVQLLKSKMSAASLNANGTRSFKSGEVTINYLPASNQYQFVYTVPSHLVRITCSTSMSGTADLYYAYKGYTTGRATARVAVSGIGKWPTSYNWNTTNSMYSLFGNQEMSHFREALNKVLTKSFGLTLADIGLPAA